MIVTNFPLHKSIVFGFCLALGTTALQASECGFLKLQKNRSLGATVSENACADPNDLGVDTHIQIAPGSRAWFEVLAESAANTNTQIICQNKSATPVDLKVVGTKLPWITVPEPFHCQAWTHEHLVCSTDGSDKNALLCAQAQIKKTELQQKPEQQHTSLAMRGLKAPKPKSELTNDQNLLKQWLVRLKPQIDLCRKTLQIEQTLTLNWKFTDTGKMTEATVKEADLNQAFVDCALEGVKGVQAPQLSKATDFAYSF